MEVEEIEGPLTDYITWLMEVSHAIKKTGCEEQPTHAWRDSFYQMYELNTPPEIAATIYLKYRRLSP